MLEKQLTHDLVAGDMKEMMHTISNLKACYDRQLPNIECLAEESAGVERKPAKLFAKLLPIMNHFVCTSFGISDEHYGSNEFKLGGTGHAGALLA